MSTKRQRHLSNHQQIKQNSFYKIQHQFDELPLDPIIPFIQEKIEKMRSSRGSYFANDLRLYTNEVNECRRQILTNVVNNKSDHNQQIITKESDNFDWTAITKENNFVTIDRMKEITIWMMRLHKKQQLNNYRQNIHVLSTLIANKRNNNNNNNNNNNRSKSERERELKRIGERINEMIANKLRRTVDSDTKSCDQSDKKLVGLTAVKGPTKKRTQKVQTAQELLIKQKNKEKSTFRTMQCLQPVDPEVQKYFIQKQYNLKIQQANKLYTMDIKQRAIHLFKYIAVTMIELYPTALIIKALPKIDRNRAYLRDARKYIKHEKLLWPNIKSEIILLDYLFDSKNHVKESEAILIIILLIDLQEDFRYAIKNGIMKFLLSCQNQRDYFALEMDPMSIEYPIVTIRGPVPWKCNYQIATNRLDQVLMVNHPVLQAINYLWYQLYDDFIVFDTSKCFRNEIPLHFDVLTQTIQNCCSIARDILMNDWLPRVADLVDTMIDYWKDLVPNESKNGGRAAILFRCIHALMSRQIQKLIQRSLDHLYQALDAFNNGNDIDKYDLSHPKLKRQPFMTLNVFVVGKFYDNFTDLSKQNVSILYEQCENDPDLIEHQNCCGKRIHMTNESAFALRECGKLCIEPYIEELPELFVSYFKEILRVGYQIPRLEYYMSQDHDQFGYLYVIDETHIDMMKLYENVRNCVAANQIGPKLYLYPIYSYYSLLLSDKMKLMTERIFEQDILPTLSSFITFMEKVDAAIDESFFLMDFVALNLFMLDCRRLNKVIVMQLYEIKNFVTDYFKAFNQKENRRICDEFEEMSMHAGERPKETAEVVALQNYLTKCKEERIVKLKDEIKKVAERVIFLLYHAELDADEIFLNSRTFLWPHELEQVLQLSGARLSVVRDKLEIELRERRSKFELYLLNERKKMETFRLRETKEFLSIDELQEKCDISDSFMDILRKCFEEAEAINVDENLLQLEVTTFPTLEEMIDKMEPIEKLWKTAHKFDKCYEMWYYGPFKNLNGNQIRNDVEMMSQTIHQLIKQLSTNLQAKRIAEQIRLKIDKFKIYLPILDAISQQGLNERHWLLISNEIGQTVNPTMFPTLSSMIDIDIVSIVVRLQEIAHAAAKEYELNMQLTNMQTEWIDIRFELIQYRDSDAFILTCLDDVQSLLDDHILKSQSMRGSPFIVALGKRATDWEEKLINMQDIMDIWMKVQSTWMYLEPIFNSDDIMRQMPIEGQQFKSIDRIWKEIMQNTYNDRRVIQATDYPNLLDALRNAFVNLETVQKGLNTYLEKKRLFFGRFFFLSNDEILEILSETKDPKRVQPHLRKCFEGINSLEFDSNNEIIALISSKNEKLQLNKKINPAAANGLVEKWLKEVQTIMSESVLTQMKTAYDNYWTIKRNEWMLKWCGQIVQTISATAWTKETIDAINGNTLRKYLLQFNEYIDQTVAIICENLSPAEQINIESLLILDIHARDVLKKLIGSNVQGIDHFDWVSQLRYYWKYDEIDKTDIISVSMMRTDIRYGMEYLGNISRLIVTPQTDRCFRSIMETMKLGLNAMANGRSGTGKMETIKDLAKAIGKKCVTFNCSPPMDSTVTGTFFKGIIQTGAWLIFYDFECIASNVMSVMAQQISTIKEAKAQRISKFLFEKTTLKLDPTCAVFVTMNPDYPVRHKIPDNMKAQFRPFGMLPLDVNYIFEMLFYVNGFKESKLLARQLVQLHQLCNEQLTPSKHYDFNIRTMKTILLEMKFLKWNYLMGNNNEHGNDYSESGMLLNAIYKVNASKLNVVDSTMFNALCKQIFVNICETNDPLPMAQYIRHSLLKRNLQPDGNLVEKILQIYQQIRIRNGIIIVGETMARKTTAWQILADTLCTIKAAGIETIREYDVSYRIINPKSISWNHLYGHFSPMAHEWRSGILAKTFREMITLTGTMQCRGWIIFDGIIDPSWSDSFHTVLDDNRKLCLASGEMIEMPELISILFETDNLEYASPMTVSRCGIVYMSRINKQWKHSHLCFVNVLKSFGLIDIYITVFETLVNWLVPAILNILHECNGSIRVNISAEQSYNIFSQFFKNFIQNQKQTINQIWFQQMFLFCLIWAYGSTLLSDDRNTLDHRLRKILQGSNDNYPKPKLFTLNRGQLFPEKMLITDYRFDGIDTWWPWLKSEDPNFDTKTSLHEALVPTKESNTMLFWLHLATSVSMPIVVVGSSGIGKSVTIRHFINKLPKEKFMNCILNLAANTSAQQVQEFLLTKLDRRRKGVFGPPVGKQTILFGDNLSIPVLDAYDSQPPIELIRQWMDHCYWYDLNDSAKIELVDLIFLGSMNVIGGRHQTFSRFYRHAFLLAFDAINTTTTQRIFTSLTEWHFSQGFSDKITHMSKAIASALCGFHEKITTLLRPTPDKFFYLFSFRDVLRVFEGITLVSSKNLATTEKLIRLWAHETYRVYSDRLSDPNDQETLLEALKISCKTHFNIDLSKAFGKMIALGASVRNETMRNLVFGNFMEPDAIHKTYDEIEDWTKLEKMVNYYLNEYNAVAEIPMNLTLFRYSIEHLTRVYRSLHMRTGHLIAIGNGGTGRMTSIKLAASMAGSQLFHFDFNQNYTIQNWKEDIKNMLMATGLNGKHTILLYPDPKLKYSTEFMDDIVALMDNSDLPNLFQSDDKTKIMDAMHVVAKQSDETVDTTPAALYKLFIERIRENFHVALVISSSEKNLRKYLNCYPSLMDYCTMDNFLAWPEDALQSIAEKFIGTMALADPKSDRNLSFANNNEPLQSTIKQIQLNTFEKTLIKMVLNFHDTVTMASKKFFNKFARTTYITPASFFELLNLFRALYERKHNEITSKRERYTTGLKNLEKAATQVCDMQQKLFDLQPKLKQLSDETEQIMVNIERDTADAEKKKEVVGADEAAANETAAAAQAIKDDCDGDLQQAIPALNSALAALNTLKPSDITIVKSLKNPPAAIKLILEAVCVIRNIKPDRRSDPGGKIIEDYWTASLKMLSDLKFLESLKTFNKDNISVSMMKRIRERYICDRDFHPDKVKNVSTACEGLCKWIRAMDIYDRVAKIVAPKQRALALAEAELADQMEKLNSKRTELQIILDKLQTLNDHFAEKSKQKKNLEDEIDNCEKKLARAETILSGLSVEQKRWKEITNSLKLELDNVIGNVLLSSAYIAYLGPFPPQYRNDLIQQWIKKCGEHNILCAKNFKLHTTLSDSNEIRGWTAAELPIDDYAIDNAIIVKNAHRFPVMIDPQGQAGNWIRNIEKPNHLKMVQYSNPNYMEIIAHAITIGSPVLLEYLHEIVDAPLSQLLEKNIVPDRLGGTLIQCQNKLINYDPNFRIYMTTCLANPHYTSELVSKITLLDFNVTGPGLHQHILSTIVAAERDDLRQRKENFTIENAKNIELLYKYETNILEVLASSEGNILEDENAINILSTSKIMCMEIQMKQANGADIKVNIDENIAKYNVVAKHVAILYNCVMQLAHINYVYQYSLNWFMALFIESVHQTPKHNETLNDHLLALNEMFTKSIHKRIIPTLYKMDRIVFSFLIRIELMASEMGIQDDELHFLLSQPETFHAEEELIFDWLSKDANQMLIKAGNLQRFLNLCDAIRHNENEWKTFCSCENLLEISVPKPYDSSDPLEQLIIFKCLRPDYLSTAIEKVVTDFFGSEVFAFDAVHLKSAFNCSNPKTPIIYLTSAGTDVSGDILNFASEMGMNERCNLISLGKDQEPIAQNALTEAIKMGNWIIFENSHIANDFMLTLEKLFIELLQMKEINEEFRWWFILEPNRNFPLVILTKAIRMVNEPVENIYEKMSQKYQREPLRNDKFFENAFMPPLSIVWYKHVFALNAFHAMIQARKRFGPIGWSYSYEFNEILFDLSIGQLRTFLKYSESISYDSFLYIVGELYYGNEIIDTNDRRLLFLLLNRFLNEQIASKDGYQFFEDGNIRIPMEPNITNSIEYLSHRPSDQLRSQDVGLHGNATYHLNVRTGFEMLQRIHRTQCSRFLRIKSPESTISSTADSVKIICKDILKKIPPQMELTTTKFGDRTFENAFQHECQRYQCLLQLITESLTNIVCILNGLAIGDKDFDKTFLELATDRIPSIWKKENYLTGQTLATYIDDLQKRIPYFQKWAKCGTPMVLCISYLYYPQAILAAIKLNFGIRTNVDYDAVSLSVEATAFESSEAEDLVPFLKKLKSENENAIAIEGLMMEGAKLNRKTLQIEECEYGVCLNRMPILLVKPFHNKTHISNYYYDVPVYKTRSRQNVSGHTDNFVTHLKLLTEKPMEHWTSRGVALLFQTTERRINS